MKRSKIRQILLSEYNCVYPHLIIEQRNILPEALHWHNYFEIELILEGKGKENINGTEYELKPGMLYLQTPNDFHDIRVDAPVTLINISFSHPLLPPDLAQQILETNKMLVFFLTGEEKTNIEGIFRQLLTEYNKKTHYDASGIGCLLEYILTFIVRKSALSIDNIVQTNILTPALIYLNTHFRDNPSLEQTARIAHINKAYFCEVFKKITGKNYIVYLTELKINYAKKLLVLSKIPIIDVCFACGFNSISNFLRVFHKDVGISPTEYRKRNGEIPAGGTA